MRLLTDDLPSLSRASGYEQVRLVVILGRILGIVIRQAIEHVGRGSIDVTMLLLGILFGHLPAATCSSTASCKAAAVSSMLLPSSSWKSDLSTIVIHCKSQREIRPAPRRSQSHGADAWNSGY